MESRLCVFSSGPSNYTDAQKSLIFSVETVSGSAIKIEISEQFEDVKHYQAMTSIELQAKTYLVASRTNVGCGSIGIL